MRFSGRLVCVAMKRAAPSFDQSYKFRKIVNEPWNHSTWTAIGPDLAEPQYDPTEHAAGEDEMAVDAGNQQQPDQHLQHDEPAGEAAEQHEGEDDMTDDAANQHQPDQQLPHVHDETRWRKVWFQRADGSWFYEYRKRKMAGARVEEDGQHAVQ